MNVRNIVEYIIYFGFAYLIKALWRRNFLLSIQNGSVHIIRS